MTFYIVSIKTINPNASPITVMKFGFIAFGRGRRDRTLGTRFWRPLLYLLSYTPIKIKKKWWGFRDSNPGPTGYEPVALTN